MVTDFEHYDDWVSDLKRIEVVTRDDAGTSARGRVSRGGLRSLDDLHPALRLRQGTGELSWRQVQGDLTETLNGRYRFEADGDETKVTYDLEVELLVPIPTFIKSRAAYRIQTQALRELKAQAERPR